MAKNDIHISPQIDEKKQEEIMAKYDREFAFRKIDGAMGKVLMIIAICWSLIQLYTAAFGVFPSTIQRGQHLGFAMFLIYVLYPMRKKNKSNKIPWYDAIFALLSVFVSGYHIVFYKEIIHRAGSYTDLDIFVSITAIFLVLEATRRIAGPVLVSVASIFLMYAYLGSMFPGFLSHRGYTINRIATYGWMSTESILGTPIMVSSTFIFLFLLFATYLKKTGIGDWLTDLAMGVAGGATGGPAKAA
ncbi:MAG: TRAP transporter large permease subunit, partial [Thermotaleaceae bacterium]